MLVSHLATKLDKREAEMLACRLLWLGGHGAGEVVQWLRALTVLPEDTDSVPSTHMAAQLSITPVPGDLSDTFTHTYMQVKYQCM